jgi:hypothetical protein
MEVHPLQSCCKRPSHGFAPWPPSRRRQVDGRLLSRVVRVQQVGPPSRPLLIPRHGTDKVVGAGAHQRRGKQRRCGAAFPHLPPPPPAAALPSVGSCSCWGCRRLPACSSSFLHPCRPGVGAPRAGQGPAGRRRPAAHAGGGIRRGPSLPLPRRPQPGLPGLRWGGGVHDGGADGGAGGQAGAAAARPRTRAPAAAHLRGRAEG